MANLLEVAKRVFWTALAPDERMHNDGPSEQDCLEDDEEVAVVASALERPC